MNKKIYDLLIIGGGPIGAIIAYFVGKNKIKLGFKNIALIQKEPYLYPGVAYSNSGGSIRWFFEDEEIKRATTKTAKFIFKLKNKVDLNLIQDNYFFLHRGILVPSLNISGKKLINFLKKESKKYGIELISGNNFKNYKKEQNIYIVNTDKKIFKTKSIIFSLGFKNKELFNLPIELEKRQLFVLDLSINEQNLSLPHTILKIGEGIVYFFIKKFDFGYRLVLGQEELYDHSLKPQAENYFKKLILSRVTHFLPFLKKTKAEKILWGIDVKNKKPIIKHLDDKVLAVNCGSAIRSIWYIGERVLEEIYKYAK